MESVLALLIAIVLGGLGVWLVDRLLPGFQVRGGFGSAMLVGGVYGLLKFLLGGLLTLLSLPLVIVTLGLFLIVINAFLLWITDKLLTRLWIRSVGSLLLATIVLSVIDILFGWVLGYSGCY